MSHEDYMDRATHLALQAGNQTGTNPLVGAVLVHEDIVIGEGYHACFGGPHAEINALNSVKNVDQWKIPESTLYVTLEPCNHFGKTPPCTEAIIKAGIKRLVVSNNDPNPQMSGSSLDALRKQGVHIIEGVNSISTDHLIRHFEFIQKAKRPWITLKWAETPSGYIGNPKQRIFITHPYTKYWVHTLRGAHVGILVGSATLLLDDPYLDTRFSGQFPPKVIVIDTKGNLPKTLNIFNDPSRVILYTAFPKLYSDIETVHIEHLDIVWILNDCLQRGIGSILVEGGTHTINQFFAYGLWNEAIRIVGEKDFSDATIMAPSANLHWEFCQSIAQDHIFRSENHDDAYLNKLG